MALAAVQCKAALGSLTLVFAGLLFFSLQCVVLADVTPTNTAAINGSVSDRAGTPVPGAKVSLTDGIARDTRTNSSGSFQFVGVPFGTYKLTVDAERLGIVAREGILVEGDVNIAVRYGEIQGQPKTLARVVTSGNFNIAPASVTTVDPIANALEGKTSWRTILEQIPGVAQTGLQNGSNALASIPNYPIAPMQVSIDGALPYETAVLLDGMPLIGGTFGGGAGNLCCGGLGFGGAGTGTDLSFYPLNAFSIADVVRGPGASSPTIVDSVGGSFLLRPPSAVDKNNYILAASTDPYGGVSTNALAAVRFDKFSTTLTYGVEESPGPLTGLGVPATIAVGAPTMINGLAFTPFSPPCTPPSCQFGELMSPNFAAASFPSYGFQQGLLVCCLPENSAWSKQSGSIALSYAVSPSVSAEIFYAGLHTLAAVPYQTVTVNFVPPSGYTGPIAAGTHLFSEINRFLTPNELEESSSLVEEKLTAQLGRGTLRIAALQNNVYGKDGFNAPTSPNVQLFGGGTLNGAPVIFNGGSYNATFLAFTVNALANSFNRDFLVSYTIPFGQSITAGLSFVKSYYTNPSSFDNSFAGFRVSAALPNTISQGTNELRFSIGGNLGEKTALDLSTYFVDANYHVPDPNNPAINFSTFNNATYIDTRYHYIAPRLGVVWHPQSSFALRAAAGGGFAEAPLNNLIGQNLVPDCSSGTICTVTLTNLNLRPETSFSFNVGADIRSSQDTPSIFSLDVYRSNLYGQFYTSTSTSGSCPTCGGLPLKVTQFRNLAQSRFEGILASLRHDAAQGIYWRASGGLTRGYVVTVPPGFYDGIQFPPPSFTATACTNCANLTVVPGVNFNGTFTGGSVPYAQGLATLGYRWKPETFVDLVTTYYGNNNTYFRPAFAALDARVGYSVSSNVSLLLTLNNVTGVYDRSVQTLTPNDLIGVPAVTGLPWFVYGEEYGPRSLTVSAQVHG